MRRCAATFVLVAAATLAGCDALDPYPAPPRAAQPGAPAGPRVAICYNTLATALAEVQTQAQKECSAGTVAQPVDTEWYLQNCQLVLPARATFVCAAKK
jgi:hypothetical protein